METIDVVEWVIGKLAIVTVVAFWVGCMVYLKVRERRKLQSLPQEKRPSPAIDAPVSRYRCDEIGLEHLYDHTGRCTDCGAMQ